MYKYCDVICRIESPPLLCTCGTTTISLVKSYLVRDKQKSSLTQTPLWLLHIETIGVYCSTVHHKDSNNSSLGIDQAFLCSSRETPWQATLTRG